MVNHSIEKSRNQESNFRLHYNGWIILDIFTMVSKTTYEFESVKSEDWELRQVFKFMLAI